MPLKFANPGSDPGEFFDQNGNSRCSVCGGHLIPQQGPFGLWLYCPWEECQEALTDPYGRQAAKMRRQDSIFHNRHDENQQTLIR